MNTSFNLPIDESGHGKYIIIKIPRETLQEKNAEMLINFANQRKYRFTLRMIGYIIIFLAGIIVGSIFHNHILSEKSTHATWKMFTTATKGF